MTTIRGWDRVRRLPPAERGDPAKATGYLCEGPAHGPHPVDAFALIGLDAVTVLPLCRRCLAALDAAIGRILEDP